MKKFCPVCGKQFGESEIVCSHCAVELRPVMVQEDSASVSNAPKKNNVPVVICVVLGVLLVAAVVLIVLFSKGVPGNDSEKGAEKSAQTETAETNSDFGSKDAKYYEEALELLDDGEFAEAYNCLIKCDNYKDAAKMLGKFKFEQTETIYDGEDRVLSTYEYDKNGNLISKINDTNLAMAYRYEYVYDANGNVSEINEYDPDGTFLGKTEYAYDADGNVILEVSFDRDYYVESKDEYEYDKNGNQSLWVSYSETGSVSVKEEYENSYDKDKNLVGTVVYENGNKSYELEYKIDENGNVTEVLCFDLNGELSEKCVYGYEYSEDSYKITRVIYDANGGSVSRASITVEKNGTYKDLPTPTRSGYTFNGWYTTGGAKVTSSSDIAYNYDHTLKAKWTEKAYTSWSTSAPPSNIPSSNIKTRTVYSYRDKETTSSTSKLSGDWILESSVPTVGDYGEWSAWSKTKPAEANNRVIETKTVTDKAAYTEYTYGRWVHSCSCSGKYTALKYCSNGHAGTFKTLKTTSPLNMIINESWGAQYKTSDGQLWFIVDNYSGSNYGGSKKIAAVTHTEYRYRDRVTTYTYNYYRWSDWSSWSTTSYTKSATREVRSRTEYCYRPN